MSRRSGAMSRREGGRRNIMPGTYEAPEAGDAPQGVKDILQSVYQS